jgi:hypothetical protein
LDAAVAGLAAIPDIGKRRETPASDKEITPPRSSLLSRDWQSSSLNMKTVSALNNLTPAISKLLE